MTYTPLVVPQSLATGEDIQLEQVDRNLAVSASGFGIGTNLVGFIDQGLRDFALDTSQADVEASTEEVAALHQVQIYFGIYGYGSRERDSSLASRKYDRAVETGRPTRSEQLLRICADARRAGGRKPDIQETVRAARSAAFAPTSGTGFCRVNDFSSFNHGEFQID